MRMMSMLLAVLIVPVPAMGQQAQPESLVVAEMTIATSVVDRQPQGAAETFSPTVGELYCWTRINGAAAGSRIEHVWYHGETEVARIPVTVNGPSWRTWTRKTIPADRTGQWRVDVVGPDGAVLKSARFAVQ